MARQKLMNSLMKYVKKNQTESGKNLGIDIHLFKSENVRS